MKSRINISGNYICRANWVDVRRKEGRIIAYNYLTDEKCELTLRQARYLYKLDGNRNPLRIKGYSKAEAIEMYNFFSDKLMLRKPGRLVDDGFIKTLTVYVPKKMHTNSAILKILNLLLLISWLPVLIFGISQFMTVVQSEKFIFQKSYWILGSIVGLLLGAILHELAHVVSCLSYGGSWCEAGLFFSKLHGAYVFLNDSRVKSRLKKAQIHAAGIETNFLLAGIILIIFSHIYFDCKWALGLVYAAFINIYFAILNFICIYGTDGEHFISALFGKDSIVECAKKTMKKFFRQKNKRKYLSKKGIRGVIFICASAIIMGVQYAMIPFMFLLNILFVYGCLSHIF